MSYLIIYPNRASERINRIVLSIDLEVASLYRRSLEHMELSWFRTGGFFYRPFHCCYRPRLECPCLRVIDLAPKRPQHDSARPESLPPAQAPARPGTLRRNV